MHFVGFASLQTSWYNVPPRSLAVNVAITTFLINANTIGAGQPGESGGRSAGAARCEGGGEGDADLVPYAQECCPDGSLAPSLSRAGGTCTATRLGLPACSQRLHTPAMIHPPWPIFWETTCTSSPQRSCCQFYRRFLRHEFPPMGR